MLLMTVKVGFQCAPGIFGASILQNGEPLAPDVPGISSRGIPWLLAFLAWEGANAESWCDPRFEKENNAIVWPDVLGENHLADLVRPCIPTCCPPAPNHSAHMTH